MPPEGDNNFVMLEKCIQFSQALAAGKQRTNVVLLPVDWIQLIFLPGHQGEVHLPGHQQDASPPAGCHEEEPQPLTSENESEEEIRIFKYEIR